MDERVRGEAEPGIVLDREDGEISLGVYLETVWRYRSIVLSSLVLMTMLFAIAVAGNSSRNAGRAQRIDSIPAAV